MIEIGGLWKKMGKNGEYFTGSLGSATLLIFPNTKKTAANQPDYRIMVAEKSKPNDGARPPQGRPQPRQAQGYQQRPPGPPPAPPMPTQPYAPGSDEPPVWDDQDPNYPQF